MNDTDWHPGHMELRTRHKGGLADAYSVLISQSVKATICYKSVLKLPVEAAA